MGEQKPEGELTPEQLWDQAVKDRSEAETGDELPPVSETPELKTEEQALAVLPDETRKLIEGLKATVAESDKRLKDVGQKLATAHGNMGNMQQQLNAAREQLEKFAPTVAEVQARKKADEEAAVVARQEKLKEARERAAEIPELAALVEYVDLRLPADAKPAAEPEPKREAKPEAKPEPQTPAEGEDAPATLKAKLQLHELHPGWAQKVRTDEFKQWYDAQPDDLRGLDTWNPQEAVKVLKAFDKHKEDAAKVAEVEAEREGRLRRGEIVQGRGSAKQGEEPTGDALWEQAKRDRAKKEHAGA